MTREQLISKAIQLVNSGVVKGYSAGILKDVANRDVPKFVQFLSEIAQQAHDINSYKNDGINLWEGTGRYFNET